MKTKIISVANRHGVSTKTVATGKAWSMCRLNYLQSLENVETEKFTQSGYGFEAKEIELDPNCIESFSELVFPCDVELVFSPKPNDLSKNWVTGFKK